MKLKLTISMCSTKQLRRMLGGMADCMITRICCGNDPYCEFVVDDPLTQEEIILSLEEESEVDDLDEVSLEKELQEVLTKLADSHKATGEHLAMLAQMAGEMTVDQIQTTTSIVSTELQGCPGLQGMFDCYDPSKIPLILAIRCKNYESEGPMGKTNLLRPIGKGIWCGKMADTGWLYQDVLPKQWSGV